MSVKSDKLVEVITELVNKLEEEVEFAKKLKKIFWSEGNLTDLEGEADRLGTIHSDLREIYEE